VVTAALLLAPHAPAVNILHNPGFEANSGRVVPDRWTRFAPPTAQPAGNYWVEAVVTPQAGSLYFKEWGACYDGTNNAAGIYQDFDSLPGNTYQASGWFYINSGDVLGPDCYVWTEVSFFGATSNLLALFKSDIFTANVGTSNWFQYPVTNACDVTAPVFIGDPFFNTYTVTGGVSQLVAPSGTTRVRYRFVYVQSANEGGSCYFDSAVLDQTSGPIPPNIDSIFPFNMILVPPSNGLSFVASSLTGTIPNNNIGVVLNGVNISSSLAISGSASNKAVSYSGLQSNTAYTASITVTDSMNFSASATTYFETTWVGIPPVLYLWEAEDFDFSRGNHYDHPDLCNTAGTSNCYYGTVGVLNFDEFTNGTAPLHLYRPADSVGTVIAGDYARKDHYLANVSDYRVDPLNGGMWLNYTRNWSNGTYWVVGRLSTDTGLSGSLTLSTVSGSTTNNLGTFSINGGQGWSTFQNVFLKDASGNNALVTLSGTQTLRLTSGGNLLPNFFALVVATPDLPFLSNVYPTGTRPFEYTNAFRFTVTATGSGFPTNGIHLMLDGFDVTPNLVITGSGASRNVVYTPLLPNAIHVAVMAITNLLGHSIVVTNRFDTFNEATYFVEAEDFDYNGGLHYDNVAPDHYFGLGATTNIDYGHAPLAGEVYNYRTAGIPEDFLNSPPNIHDYVRTNFAASGAIDYVLTFFAPGDWANYTHLYPAGSFMAYMRTSGSGPFTVHLDQVVSGATTTNQVTAPLGQFSGVGKNYTTYDWAPLTDAGQAAPAVLHLNGLATLRLTTDGNCNPNYFMLVPVSGLTLGVQRVGSATILSFPTQSGVAYRVFYRTNLTAGSWSLLTTVMGNGSAAAVSDSSADAERFYKVVAP
jgi:hypothetical protein